MDTIFKEAVSQVSEMPKDVQREIGEALLDGVAQRNLPVIEFTSEENGMIDEALEEVERGEVVGQDEMKAHFDELRTKAYAAT